MQSGWIVVKCSYSACFLSAERVKNVSSDTCAAGVAIQSTDVLALVMFFLCAVLLLTH